MTSSEQAEVPEYLRGFFGDGPSPGTGCGAVGMVAYQKERDASPSKPARPASGGVADGGSSQDGGKGGKGGHARGGGKARRAAKGTRGLDSLNPSLRPGRHACSCNATRHALLYNCLACGKIICEQEGEGDCLFCGSDPHAPRGAADARAASDASAAAARLVEFDRSSAKRTAVIDDQEDYFATDGADAWLSAQEKEERAAIARAREENAERRRRELRLTVDLSSRTIVREDALSAAAFELGDADGGREGDGGADGGAGAGGAGASAGGVWACSDADGGGHTGEGAGERRIACPRVARVNFRARAEGSTLAGRAEARGLPDGMHDQAMAEGLRHSVCKVQHDNPWTIAAFDAMLTDDGCGAARAAVATAAEEVEAAAEEEEEAVVAVAEEEYGAARAASHALDPEVAAVGAELEGESRDPRCLSLHQPWASLLVRGIKTVEGRSWTSKHRGLLWIASTAKPVDVAEVAALESSYRLAERTPPAKAAEKYPSSALLGAVHVADVLPHEEYEPAVDGGGVRGTGRWAATVWTERNDSSFAFLCAGAAVLSLPIRVSGQHKIWRLDRATASAARSLLRPPTPARRVADGGGDLPSASTQQQHPQ